MAPRETKRAGAEADPMAEHRRGQALENDKLAEDVRAKRIANDSSELAHKRESSAAGTKHFNDRRLAETKTVQAHSEMEQHKTAHAKAIAKHEINDRTIKTASAQEDLHNKRAMHAHNQEQAKVSAERAQEKHERWRTENAQKDEDRAHRYIHDAQLHHHLRTEARRRAWVDLASGLTGSHGGLSGEMRRQVGGRH